MGAQHGLDDFELYNVAGEFRRQVYALIKQLPRSEQYCLDQQMRRAAVSITNNVTEGHGRWHFQENIRFCQIARGSIEETIDDLNVCLDEHYGDSEAVNQLKEDAYSLIGRLNSYIVHLRRSKQGEAR